MSTFEKIATTAFGILIAGIILTCGAQIYICTNIKSDTSVAESSDDVSENSSSASGDTVNLEDYVTYFDLAYAAYTNPEEFLGKELTFVGYYSDSASYEEDEETSEDESTSVVYHFLTTYGQIEECHMTIEFTTADNNYPEIGTVIKITGKFTSYDEDGTTYYTIACDNYSTVDV